MNCKKQILGKVLLGASALFLSLSTANASECNDVANPNITIAVASNLWEPAQSLVGNYTESLLPDVVAIQVCHGSTGSLVTEINTGNSNYSLFLAANTTAPDEIYPIYRNGTAFNYTTGIPALWTTNASLIEFDGSNPTGNISISALTVGTNFVVIADPTVAPYGLAAFNIMNDITDQWDDAKPYMDIEANIDDTYKIIFSNSNNVGYVALSQICRNGNITEGYGYRNYPPDYNIPQAGIQIDQGSANNTLAAGFVAYLLNPSTAVGAAQYILQTTYCYGARP